MKVYEVAERGETLTAKLLEIWRGSVAATHSFLSPEEIDRIAGYIPDALRSAPHLIVAGQCAEEPAAFMGINRRKLEMLFVAPQHRGRGIGRELMGIALRDYMVEEVCVNEDNPQARGFYERMGFYVYERSALDEQGDPYPLLHMKLCK